MESGETFKTDGYERMAEALFLDGGGIVVVLGNNSTHFLVATHEVDDREVAKLVESFPYGSNYEPAYRRALERMVAEAMMR